MYKIKEPKSLCGFIKEIISYLNIQYTSSHSIAICFELYQILIPLYILSSNLNRRSSNLNLKRDFQVLKCNYND